VLAMLLTLLFVLVIPVSTSHNATRSVKPAQLANASVLHSMPVSLLDEVSAFAEDMNHSSLVRGSSKACNFKCAEGSVEQSAAGPFKRFCDEYFERIREAYGDPDLVELLDASGLDITSSGDGGAGKSGANFLKTTDGKYFLKTMSERDLGAWNGAAVPYTDHMVEYVKTTTIVRYIGILKTKKGRANKGKAVKGKVWLVMSNCLLASFPVIYDLKGSSVNREQKELDEEGNYKVGLDSDWRENELRMHLDDDTQVSILQTLKSDSKLLEDSNLLDYSLIIGQAAFALKRCKADACIAPVCVKGMGCVDVAHKQEDPIYMAVKQSYCSEREDGSEFFKKRNKHGCLATLVAAAEHPDKGEVTLHFECFGIIDVLKPWDLKAKAEQKLAFGENVSAQSPKDYAARFYEAMEEKTFTQDDAESRAKLQMKSVTCGLWGTGFAPSRCLAGCQVALLAYVVRAFFFAS